MAFSGQSMEHAPHPWHISGNVSVSEPMTTIALNWQISPHNPQEEHFSMSTEGTGNPISWLSVISGFNSR
jgi:hypothetical protein